MWCKYSMWLVLGFYIGRKETELGWIHSTDIVRSNCPMKVLKMGSHTHLLMQNPQCLLNSHSYSCTTYHLMSMYIHACYLDIYIYILVESHAPSLFNSFWPQLQWHHQTVTFNPLFSWNIHVLWTTKWAIHLALVSRIYSPLHLKTSLLSVLLQSTFHRFHQFSPPTMIMLLLTHGSTYCHSLPILKHNDGLIQAPVLLWMTKQSIQLPSALVNRTYSYDIQKPHSLVSPSFNQPFVIFIISPCLSWSCC